ncbi:MAG: hypothetical protein H0X45_11005 [Planctomycetes bacterium]|nr:hypothetical protein [Planctomycetota bacterium]
MAESATADLLLETYGPEERLVRYARDRIVIDPGAFWPRIISARAALDVERLDEAHEHALVALGREPHAVWPHLLLAYIALARDDGATLLAEAEAAERINPDHLEPVVLKAVALARSGDRQQAQAIIDGMDAAGHLQYHLQHPVGHPMERAVNAVVAAGVIIPVAAPDLGPVVPSTHQHHGHHR